MQGFCTETCLLDSHCLAHHCQTIPLTNQKKQTQGSHVKKKAVGVRRTSFSETSDRLTEEASHAPASLREKVTKVGLSQLPRQRQFALGVFQRQVVMKALHCLLQTILL